MEQVHLTDFFFQAEDGIRDRTVTGVQTCALPIFGEQAVGHRRAVVNTAKSPAGPDRLDPHLILLLSPAVSRRSGRASCRERGEISDAIVVLKQKWWYCITS